MIIRLPIHYLRLRFLSGRLLTAFIVLCFSHSLLATEYLLSEPHTHENLTLHFVQLKDSVASSASKAKILTLDEALSQNKIIVHETGDVNELQVENNSADEVVFIQAGDIVKGGKQDRVTTTDMLLQPKSGKVAMGAFCVEQGRWRPRGAEDVKVFSSSINQLSSKDLKIATFSRKQQGEVWKEVGEVQRKLRANVDSSVQDDRSKTSLQLSLESEAVKREVEDYLAVLKPVAAKYGKASGYVTLINGKMVGADLFASPELFSKQWAKLLLSSATEALAESNADTKEQNPAPEEIARFLSESEKGSAEQHSDPRAGTVVRTDTQDVFFYESRINRDADNWVHRGYLKK